VITIKNLKRGNKRAQAAMEFLTTYGWAILILLIVIVALANLGVFKAKGAVNACIPIAPFSSCDLNLKADGGTVPLPNGVGVAISTADTLTPTRLVAINNIFAAGVPRTCTITAAPVTITIGADGRGTATFTCTAATGGTAGQDYKADLILDYTAGSGLVKQLTMQVQGKLL